MLAALVVAVAGLSWAMDVGWFERASYNGYVLCGYGTSQASASPAPVLATGVTQTLQNSSCYPEAPRAYANQISRTALWGSTPWGPVLCGSVSSGYAVTLKQSTIAYDTGCTNGHGNYTVCIVVGGWITGTLFPDDHFPVCAAWQWF